MSCTIYTTSHNKEFSFRRHYIHCIIDRFGDDFLSSLGMWYRYGYIVFNTSIRYNKYSVLIGGRILIDAIKFISMSDYYIGVFLVKWMKRETIRELFTKQKPRKSSVLKLLEEGKTSFRWLLVSIIGLLIFKHCLDVRWIKTVTNFIQLVSPQQVDWF